MRLLCGQSNRVWHYLQGKTDRCGVLLSPSYWRRVPFDSYMPFALDNGAFIAWRDGKEWDEAAWKEMLTEVARRARTPLWCAVPDVVADKNATIERWPDYVGEVKRRGWAAAFCVQDGMTPGDVPSDADVVFIGGSDRFKFRALPGFCRSFRRVHCARVNSPEMIQSCERNGCESIDGTGWFRDPSRKDKVPFLSRFLSGEIIEHPELLKL